MGEKEENDLIVPNPKPIKLRAGDEWKKIQSQIAISRGAAGARIGAIKLIDSVNIVPRDTSTGGIVEESTVSGPGVVEGSLELGAGLQLATEFEGSDKIASDTTTGGTVGESTVSGPGVVEGSLELGAGLQLAAEFEGSDKIASDTTTGGTVGESTVSGPGVVEGSLEPLPEDLEFKANNNAMYLYL